MFFAVLPARDQVCHVLALVRLFFSDARRARQLDLDRAKHGRVGQGVDFADELGVKVELCMTSVSFVLGKITYGFTFARTGGQGADGDERGISNAELLGCGDGSSLRLFFETL